MTPARKMNVLITGASGFIGSALSRRLAPRPDLHVTGLVRQKEKGDFLLELGAAVAVGDVRDDTTMTELFSAHFDIVCHVAAWLNGSPRKNYHLVNVTATKRLLSLAETARVARFIYTSSIMVYGLHDSIDVLENAILAPYGDDYGDTKIEAEAIVQEASRRGRIETCIVRPGMVYGPQSQAWTVQIIDWGKRGLMPMVDNGRGSAFPVYIDNLIDLLELCIDHPDAANSTFNAVDDGPITFNEFLGSYMSMIPTTRALRLSGSPLKTLAKLLSFVSPGRSLPYLIHQLTQTGQIQNEAAKTKLGWQPAVSLRDGMARTEAWLRASGYI